MPTNAFFQKVSATSFIDTKKYRYFSTPRLSYILITRCKQSDLDTVNALFENHEVLATVNRCNGSVLRL